MSPYALIPRSLWPPQLDPLPSVRADTINTLRTLNTRPWWDTPPSMSEAKSSTGVGKNTSLINLIKQKLVCSTRWAGDGCVHWPLLLNLGTGHKSQGSRLSDIIPKDTRLSCWKLQSWVIIPAKNKNFTQCHVNRCDVRRGKREAYFYFALGGRGSTEKLCL